MYVFREKRRSLVLVLVFIVTSIISGIAVRDAEAAIKVGLGETVITPPNGTIMEGYARKDTSKGVHDDLYARSLLVEGDDGTTVILMTLSLLESNQKHVAAIREGITRETGIPGQNVMVSATHTHSGPSFRNYVNPEYEKLLVERCIESGVQAWKNRTPGKIGIDSTTVFEMGRANRRLLYGGLHPDPEVGIIKIENTSGKLLGVAFNYGCHPSTLDLHNLLISQDWPYYTIEAIKKKLGKDVWVAYYQAAQGDIKVGYTSELSAVGAEMPIRNWWYAEQKGNQLAEVVVKAVPKVRTKTTAAVKAADDKFEYPLMESFPLTVEQAEKALENAKQTVADMEARRSTVGERELDQAKVDVFLGERRLGKAKVAADPNRPRTMMVEQQAIRIGDAVFVSFPGELFSEIGLEMKRKSPFPLSFVMGLANEMTFGYLPTEKEFLDGNYEVLTSPFSPKAAQTFIDVSLKLIDEVR